MTVDEAAIAAIQGQMSGEVTVNTHPHRVGVNPSFKNRVCVNIALGLHYERRGNGRSVDVQTLRGGVIKVPGEQPAQT